MRKIVECVPNFSEGRREGVVEAIASAIESANVTMLDVEMDADHNRSVITFVGPPEAAVLGAFRGIEKAVELIDLNVHEGAHPRLGAADVVPFVPVSGVGMEECIDLARRLGRMVWERLRVPVYFYEHAATREERRSLPKVRKGQFEGLREEVRTNPERAPDLGERELHPTAGAVVIGAREPLIAFNVNLDTRDVKIAKAIAKRIRERSGGMPGVRALGFEIGEKNCVQVSMNLVDFRRTNMSAAYSEIARIASKEHGVDVLGSEVVGLVPLDAVSGAFTDLIRAEGFTPDQILEVKMERMSRLHQLRVDDLVSRLASSDPTPGGGSAAALALALGVGLTKMAALHTNRKSGVDPIPVDRMADLLTGALTNIQKDTDAFDRVMHAYRLPRTTQEEREARKEAISGALRGAAEVPLSVMRDALEAMRLLRDVSERCDRNIISDVESAAHMLNAAFLSAMANVRVNVRSLKGRGDDLLTEAETYREEWDQLYGRVLQQHQERGV